MVPARRRPRGSGKRQKRGARERGGTNPILLLPEFLLVILNSDEFANQVSAMTSGSAQPQLPINRLSKIEFVLPPIALQKGFTQRVTEIRVMQAEQAASRQRLDDLFQSMLHRAFNGEL
jgi:type I restriction enzyme, S subunit